MTTAAYDAILVGARCAGSPTATLLARQGHRVLLLDRDLGAGFGGGVRPEMGQLLGATAASQDAQDQFVSVMAGTMPVREFFAPENGGRVIAGT
ncbi:MAG: hypothetical protein ABR576_15190 [Thermoanaerobaculia bacterium]